MESLVLTQDDLDEVVDAYSKVGAFAFDVETIGDDRLITHVNRVAWLQLSTTGRCDVIPMGHPHGEFLEWSKPLTGTGLKRQAQGLELRESDYSKAESKWTPIWSEAPEQLTPAQVFSALKPVFMSPDILKIGQNLIFDLESVAKYLGGPPVGPYFDCMVAGFLLDSRLAERGDLKLDGALKRELGYVMAKGVGKDISLHSFSDVWKYSYLDAKYTWLLYKSLAPKLEAHDLHKVMYEIEMPVMEVVTDMELTGAPIDGEALKVLSDKLSKDLDDATGDCYRAAGVVFNINSNPEKQRLLFSPKDMGGQGLKPIKLTDGGKKKEKEGKPIEITDYSTDGDVLDAYPKNKLAQALKQYQTLAKLHSGYVIPYSGGEVTKTVGKKTKVEVKESLLIKGRIHARFKQTGAETGRFSSSNPNLQNVPNASTEYGKMIRNLFVAPEGFKLISADYSQIEPRIIASFSGDPIMMENYLNGEDIYTTIGNTVGVDRAAGKVLVLSMAYGVGPDKIATSIGTTTRVAAALLDEFDSKMRGVARYKAEVIRNARRQNPPHVKTLMGRVRYLPELKSPVRGFVQRAERQAFNTVIQGSAADIMKVALIRAHKSITPLNGKIILTVHDEIVCYVPEENVEESVVALKEAMEGFNMLKVPLIAEAKVADRWGDAK